MARRRSFRKWPLRGTTAGYLRPFLMLTKCRTRRLSAGERTNPIPLLRDIDQPFIFNVNLSKKGYRLEFYDTSSPENWHLLDPDVVVMCYDISQRLSLINLKRYVSVSSNMPPASLASPDQIP